MTEQDGSEKRIKSNETLFTIIEFLRENNSAPLGEIATELDIAKSTVHYHLKTPLELGFVTKRDGEYQIGLRFLDYAIEARQNLEIFPSAKATIDELANQCGERVWCVTEENGMAVFLYAATGDQAVETDARVGARYPIHQISAGKAILAHLPEERAKAIVDAHGLEARTENTIVDREALFEELAEIRENGYAINREESVEGLHAVGAPIPGREKDVVGAVSIVGPANRLTDQRIENEYAPLLLGSVNEIELNLQYSR